MKTLYIVPLLCLYFSGVAIAGGDNPGYEHPAYFTANAGQWDERVQYALAGGRSSVWFCNDGIVLARPRESKEMPREMFAEMSECIENETLALRFVNPSPNMRIRALDTARAFSHFYHGGDAAKWRENVSNHRAILYENVWDGVDIEFQFSGNSGDSNHGSNQPIAIISGSDSSTNHEIAVNISGSGQGKELLYEDKLNSYMAYISGGRDGAAMIYANGEGPYIAMFGLTTASVFPLKNAYQGTFGGESDFVIVKYNAERKEVIYSTFIGSRGSEWTQTHNYRTQEVMTLKNGCVYATGMADAGFPVTNGIPGMSVGSRGQGVVFSLDESGRQLSSSYIGGPGLFRPITMHVSDSVVSLFGAVAFDTIRTVTENAVERHAKPYEAVMCGLFVRLAYSD